PSVRLRLVLYCQARRSVRADDLAGIHDVPRIDRLLDRAHEVEPSPMLDTEIFHLALADAMLASAGAIHADGTQIKSPDEFVGALDFARVFHVDHDREMEVAVADMTEHRRNQPAPLDVFSGLADAVYQSRYRHADVGRYVLRPRPQCK